MGSAPGRSGRVSSGPEVPRVVRATGAGAASGSSAFRSQGDPVFSRARSPVAELKAGLAGRPASARGACGAPHKVRPAPGRRLRSRRPSCGLREPGSAPHGVFLECPPGFSRPGHCPQERTPRKLGRCPGCGLRVYEVRAKHLRRRRERVAVERGGPRLAL